MNVVAENVAVGLPQEGALRLELVPVISNSWMEFAAAAGIDVNGFPRAGTLPERLAWARGRNLTIGTILTRYSTKDQDSTEAQATACLQSAAQRGIYVPPEYVCADEGVSGRKMNRHGLNRARQILRKKRADVLLVFKVSRLFRRSSKGFEFFEEELVEAGLRGISVTQGIDTADDNRWQILMQVHNITDEMFLRTTADHVLVGMEQAFRQGRVIGALNIGYRGVVVPDAGLTAKGKPVQRIEVNEPVAVEIRKHYQLIAEGLPLRSGWRKWNEEVGVADPRSCLKRMSYCAYRRLLSNSRYRGEFSFKRMKNVWQSRRDCVGQVARPLDEVLTLQFEHLRIVEDAVFAKVQERLNSQKTGPKRRRSGRSVQLWDLVHQYFICPHCNCRFVIWGNHGSGMHCKNDLHCPKPVNPDRQKSVVNVCEELTRLLRHDEEMITAVISEVQQQDPAEVQTLQCRLGELIRQEEMLTRSLGRTMELLQQVPDQEAAELNEAYRSTTAERARVRLEKLQVEQALNAPLPVFSPEAVRQALGNLTQLLIDAVAGRLGEDQVHQAADLFAALVNRRIEVYSEPRPEREWIFVRGRFVPALLTAVRQHLQDPRLGGAPVVEPVDVWLRSPPLRERLADEAKRLIDEEGLNAREVSQRLSEQFEPITPDVVRLARLRWYEMRGLTAPRLPHWKSRVRAQRAAC